MGDNALIYKVISFTDSHYQQDSPNVWLFLEHGEGKGIELFLAALFSKPTRIRNGSDLVPGEEIETIVIIVSTSTTRYNIRILSQ